MPSRCPERKVLSDAVAASVISALRAKKEYDAGKSKRTANVTELLASLANARKTELEATNSFNDQVKNHGC
jgi:hypothetical protein